MPLATRHTPGIYVEEVSRRPEADPAVGTSTPAFVGDAPKRRRVPELVPQAVNNWSQFLAKFVPDEEEVDGHAAVDRRVRLLRERRHAAASSSTRPASRPSRSGLDGPAHARRDRDRRGARAQTDPRRTRALKSHCERAQGPGRRSSTRSEDVDDLGPLRRRWRRSRRPTTTAAAGRRSPARPRQGERGGLGRGRAQAPAHPPTSPLYLPWITVLEPLEPGARRRAAVRPHRRHLGPNRRHARRPQGAGQRDRPRRAQRDLPADARRAGRAQPVGVNCIRLFAREGIRVWGARTLADPASEWRYLNVRRLFNMIEESIAEATSWIVFEPNDRTLWKSIRRDIGAFLTRVWRDGALMGATPEEAFFVKCDEETNPPEVIDAGQVRRGHRHRAGQAGRVRRLPRSASRRPVPRSPASRRPTERSEEADMPEPAQSAAPTPDRRGARELHRPVPRLQLQARDPGRHRGPLHRVQRPRGRGPADPLPGGRRRPGRPRDPRARRLRRRDARATA